MNKSETVRAGLLCAFLAACGTVVAGPVSLSGKVVRTDGTALPGVVVDLAAAGLSDTTDAQGNWSFAPASVGIGARGAVPGSGAARLALDQGRLSVRFAGRDAAGRGAGIPGTAGTRETPMRGRAVAAHPDTVVYSYGQRVFRRDTLSNLDTAGILRVYDTTWNAAILYGELRDARDGRTYRTVQLGTQAWMAENLAYAGPSDTIGSCYFNSPDSCAKYGRLYRWNEATALPDSCNGAACLAADHGALQGACPTGWHLPTPEEWTRLTDTLLGYVGAGAALKSVAGWKVDNGTDAYGFRALPAGYRGATGSFYQAGSDAMWWASLESDPGTSWDRSLGHLNTIVGQGFIQRTARLSVRCVRD